MNLNQIRFVDAFNYSCPWYRGEFNTSPSYGGLDPFRERCNSLQEAADLARIPIDTLLENINWDRLTITQEGQLLKSSHRGGQWRFELTLRE